MHIYTVQFINGYWLGYEVLCSLECVLILEWSYVL